MSANVRRVLFFSPIPTIETLCAATPVKTEFCSRMSFNVGYGDIELLQH
jgi:hypothetical protein